MFQVSDRNETGLMGRRFLVPSTGMDFKIRCTGCGHEVMVPRVKAEKNIKKIIRQEQDEK